MALIGYIKIGDNVDSNIIMNMTMTPAIVVAIVMEVVNLICTFLISSNTVYQSLEEMLKVKKGEAVREGRKEGVIE